MSQAALQAITAKFDGLPNAHYVEKAGHTSCALLCVSLHVLPLLASSLPLSLPPHHSHTPLALLCFASLFLPWQN